MSTLGLVVRVALAVALIGAASKAFAGAIEVSPINITLSSGAATSLTVSNRGTDATAVQVRGFAWSQSDVADDLERTDALIVSPPIFQLPGGTSQTVRVLLRGAAAKNETTYRLLLDELPPPDSGGRGVHFAFRISVPVFEAPLAPVAPKLQWRVLSTPEGGADLVVVNTGNYHNRLLQPQLRFVNGAVVHMDSPPNPYILAGMARRWHLSPDAAAKLSAGSKLTLSGDTDEGPVSGDVPVVPFTMKADAGRSGAPAVSAISP